MIERAEPVDFVAHYEMLRLNCNRMLAIVKRTANSGCCLCCNSCLACDALELLRELGIDKND